jgi:uncharacterized protein YjbI with pentapeptide repeats
MTHIPDKCKFKLWFLDEYHCHLKARRDGLCIFHLPKLNKEKKEQLSVNDLSSVRSIEDEFQLSLDELLSQHSASPESDTIDMRGFCFPLLNWKGKEFTKKLDLQDASFEQEVHFDKATFHQDVNFHSATFADHANFSETIFNGEAYFGGATFNKSAWFHDTIFKGEATFLSEFNKLAYFYGACFSQQANFLQARFKERAIFPKTKFEGKAVFLEAVFSDMANFIESIFEQEAMFSGAFFEQATTFAGASFRHNVSFRSATFSGAVYFAPYTKKCILGECDFRRLIIKKEAEFNFQQVNLGRSRFTDTDLEKIVFRDIEWGNTESRWVKRAVLWDEVCPLEEDESERNYEKIAENYRQLVLNYESKRDYDVAEAFHIGEMEMRRKKQGAYIKSPWLRWLRERLNSYWLYRLLSNYGTSYWQALTVLLALLLIFSAAFLYTGFQPNKENISATGRAIEYNVFTDSTHHNVSLGQWLSDYGEAVLFSLSIITFQRERFYEPVGWVSQLFLYLAVLTITTQGALVVLSVRRRFRR